MASQAACMRVARAFPLRYFWLGCNKFPPCNLSVSKGVLLFYAIETGFYAQSIHFLLFHEVREISQLAAPLCSLPCTALFCSLHRTAPCPAPWRAQAQPDSVWRWAAALPVMKRLLSNLAVPCLRAAARQTRRKDWA